MKHKITFCLSLLALSIWSCAGDNTKESTTNLSEQFPSAMPVEELKKMEANGSTGNEKLDSFVSAVPKDRVVHIAPEGAKSSERAAIDICNCTHFYLKMLEITMEISPNDMGFRNAYFDLIEKEAPKAEKCMSDVKKSYDMDEANRADPQAFAVEVDQHIRAYCPDLLKAMNAAAAAKAQKK